MIDVAVVGAGPYGLAVSAHLQHRRVEYRLFGRPMANWRDRMPAGMVLRSEGFASSLADPGREFTLERFCAEQGLDVGGWGCPVPIEVFREYADWFLRELALPVEEVMVQRLARSNRGFTLTLGTGEQVEARRVVLALGLTYDAYLPPELAALAPGGGVSHTSEHTDLSGFAGRDVVVVGAGQSALETAALAHEHGATVRVIARRGRLSWNPTPHPLDRRLLDRARLPVSALCSGWGCWVYANAPMAVHRLPQRRRLLVARRSFGPAGAWWLKDRVVGQLPIACGRAIAGAAAGDGSVRLQLIDPEGRRETVEAEHVIAGTGFRVDQAAWPMLVGDVRAALVSTGGYPVLSRSFESSVTGLHVVGVAATAAFGPVMRFMCGAGFAARRVSGSVAGGPRARLRRARGN